MNNRVFASRALAGVGVASLALGMVIQHVAARSGATEREGRAWVTLLG